MLRLPLIAALAVLLTVTGSSSSAAAAVTVGAGPAAAPAGRWAWPIPAPRVITQPFIAPATAYSAGHRGIDLRTTPGQAVTAPTSGTVHFVGTVVDRPLLTLRHPGGLLSSYEPLASPLTEGAAVARGDPIGTVAMGGHCGSSCLHLGVRVDGQYVSPLAYLGGIPRAVLLPTR